MFFLTLVLACSTHRNQLHVTGDPPRTLRGHAIAEPVFWGDTLDGDQFRKNAVVGAIFFSGGFVTENDGRGLHNVSKEVSIADRDRYREQVASWLRGVLPPTVVVEDPPPPRPILTRGSHPMDGKDNQSLPRFTFEPQPTGPLPQPTIIPWIVNYYAHNAGWFYGQTWGTGAGARIRILLVAHDTSGAVVAHSDLDASRISERVFSPSEPQLQDMLIALERRLAKKLKQASP